MNSSFEIIVDEKNPAKINFNEMHGCVIKEVSINQVQPASVGKKIHFFCTYDVYYCESDDNDAVAATPLREKLEVTQFIIGTSPNFYKTEFIMSSKMNPTFTVEGPGSLKFAGKLIQFRNENKKSKEKEEDVNVHNESIEAEEKK